MLASAPSLRSHAPLMLDWIERVAVAGLFLWMVVSRIVDGHRDWFLVLYSLSEGLVVAFILVRRTTEKVSPRMVDWLLAVGATALPMLAHSGGASLLPQNYATMIVLVGIAIQLFAKLTLRRSFGIVAANRGLKMSGPYRYLRHPMYAGYLVAHIGIFATSPNSWNAAVYTIAWIIQIARLLAEERLLKQDDAYAAYMGNVRYRLIPGVF